MEKMGESDSIASLYNNEMERWLAIAKSWGYESQMSGLVLKDSMLRFWHNGALMFCPGQLFSVHQKQVDTAKKIEDIVTGEKK